MTTLAPPLSPQHDIRPRAVSAMSYSSNRSRRSNSSSTKADLTESPKDKRRLNTKADPSKALVEAQPAAVALEESSIDNLRRSQHKDADGNIITDPDRSNPTRHRLERPLDTIRAFNAAAEGTTTRRASSYGSRPGSQVGYDNRDGSRRNSYYGGGGSNVGYSPRQPKPSHGGYYRNNSYGFGPQSTVEEAPGASQQYARGWRQPSNPYYAQHNENVMPVHSYHYSNDTMTSGSEETGKSTNPSSQNSSYDQLHQLRKTEENGYHNPYVNELQFSPITNQQQYTVFDREDEYVRPTMGGPAPPPKEVLYNDRTRAPIPLNSSNPTMPPFQPDTNSRGPGRRQSLIKRMFGRRDS